MDDVVRLDLYDRMLRRPREPMPEATAGSLPADHGRPRAVSPEGCEHTEEVRRIDRARITDDRYVHFTSTQDELYGMDAEIAFASSLPIGCSWMYFLTFFGHELERAKNCEVPGGFELEISIPNEDPATYSMWLIEGLDVNLL
jgi:hypothetical protein